MTNNIEMASRQKSVNLSYNIIREQICDPRFNGALKQFFTVKKTIKKMVAWSEKINFLMLCKYRGIYPRTMVKTVSKVKMFFDKKYSRFRKVNGANFCRVMLNSSLSEAHENVKRFDNNVKRVKSELLRMLKNTDSLSESVANYLKIFEDYNRLMLQQSYEKNISKASSPSDAKHNVIKANVSANGPASEDKLDTSNWVVNISGKSVPDEMIEFFKCSTKFNKLNKVDEKYIDKFVTECKYNLELLDITNRRKDVLRNQINYIVNNNKNQQHLHEIPTDVSREVASNIKMLESKTRSFLKRNEDILVVKADQTHKVVIMTKSQYDEKIKQIISNKTDFFRQRLDPTKDVNNKVTKFV